jgi:sulfoxide reductase catalytic subunit YedY
MLVRSRRSWELPDSAVTPESAYLNRRALLGGLAAGSMLLGGKGWAADADAAIAPELYPAKRNEAYVVDRPITAEMFSTRYNNFYEFGSEKGIWQDAQALKLRPWQVVVDGLVDRPITLDAEELIRKMPIEERVYRHRCVEGWSMTVPWSGFPLKALLDLVGPQSGARYVQMTTFEDPDMAPGQKQFWYPWPYVEGLTVAEAGNDLAFIATGLYGKPIHKQNGAPLRLATPWKYGFKSVKSIVRFELVTERPKTFWEALQSSEYGFWANVNPAVPHPRWSQAHERVLGTNEEVPTLLFNGYGDQVADLYRGLDNEALYM